MCNTALRSRAGRLLIALLRDLRGLVFSSALLGVPGIVAALDVAVAFALPTDGAAMTTQAAGDLGLAV